MSSDFTRDEVEVDMTKIPTPEDIERSKTAPKRLHELALSKLRQSNEYDVTYGGLALRCLREEAGLTQAQMAELLDMKQTEISKLERRRNPQLQTIQKYVTALGGRLKMSAYFNDEQVESPQNRLRRSIEDNPRVAKLVAEKLEELERRHKAQTFTFSQRYKPMVSHINWPSRTDWERMTKVGHAPMTLIVQPEPMPWNDVQ
jgi:transcriptional regulator with XRE-family HTH domain